MLATSSLEESEHLVEQAVEPDNTEVDSDTITALLMSVSLNLD